MSKTYTQVAIILGSESDEPEFNASKATEVLNACGIRWELSILSAHRHLDELKSYCRDVAANGTHIFICGAGLSAALPGAVASAIGNTRLVLGVPIAGGEWQGMDALSAMQSLPPGTVVSTQKFGRHGFTHAAITAVQVLAIGGGTVYAKLFDWLGAAAKGKPPILGRQSSQPQGVSTP